MKKLSLIFIALVFFSEVWSQGEGNIWYFPDNVGLDFNSGAPTVLLDGQLQISSNPNPASISDALGNLKFYTNGNTLWDKNHGIMPNGDALNGTPVQQVNDVLIANHPDRPDLYYLMYNLSYSDAPHEFGYAIIDMSLNNGLGDVVTKNTLLNNSVGEAIGGVKHANGKDIWFVVHGYDDANFYAYLLTASGINPTPVVSTTGEVMVPRETTRNVNFNIKFSPNGSKLVHTALTPSNTSNVFDFQPLNGCVAHPILLRAIETEGTGATQNTLHDRDVEFSPSGDLLYVSTDHNLLQYDLTAPILADSAIRISTSDPDGDVFDLQYGPDGKIYINMPNDRPFHLGVIHNPNNRGTACNYDNEGLYLEGGKTFTSLPEFIQSQLRNRIYYEGVCLGEMLTSNTSFSLDDIPDSVVWDFGDPSSGPGNMSTDINPTHNFNAPGIYNITASTSTSGKTETLKLDLEIFLPPNNKDVPEVDLKQCDDDTDGISVFNLEEITNTILPLGDSEKITFHESETEANQGINPISNASQYLNQTPSIDMVWARVENKAFCYAVTQLNLIVTTTQIPNDFISTIYGCDEGNDGIASFDFSLADEDIRNIFPVGQEIEITYYTSLEDGLAERNRIENINSYMNTGSLYLQDIYVRVDSKQNNSCLGLGKHLILETLESPSYELDNEATICLNDNPELTIDTFNASGTFSYEWRDDNGGIIGTDSRITIFSGGRYYVTAKADNSCETVKNIQVTEVVQSVPSEDWFTIVNQTVNNSIRLDTSFLGEGDFEFSLDEASGNYQDSPFFENLSNGEHAFYIRDKLYCGVSPPFRFKTFGKLSFPKFLTPNNDNHNDVWNVKEFSTDLYKTIEILIFDRYGKLLKSITPFTQGWDGTFNGMLLSPDDYWYTAKIVDINDNVLIKTGHFSLILR